MGDYPRRGLFSLNESHLFSQVRPGCTRRGCCVPVRALNESHLFSQVRHKGICWPAMKSLAALNESHLFSQVRRGDIQIPDVPVPIPQ